jgi:hypothetical protein
MATFSIILPQSDQAIANWRSEKNESAKHKPKMISASFATLRQSFLSKQKFY